jgi:O-antigen/teichoic acid export membrane protein
VPSLQVLAWTLAPLAIAIVLAQVLFSADRQALDLRTNVIASIVSVAGNLLLIPRFGAVGAACATLVAATTYAAFQYAWTRRFVVDPDALGDLGKIALAALASTAVIALLQPTSVWIATAAGLAVYGAALLIFGFVQAERLWRVGRLAPSVSEPPR